MSTEYITTGRRQNKKNGSKTGISFPLQILLLLKRERIVGGDPKRSDSERTWFRGLSGKKRVSEIFEKYTAENGDM